MCNSIPILSKTRDDKVSIAILVEIAKDCRVEHMKEEKNTNGNLPATGKQKVFLERLGAVIPQDGITNNGNIIWEPGMYNNIADFNLDGKVDFKDFADFSGTWLWQSKL